jgi:glycosyltransferase involved in cell wall biosynthesis
VNWLTTCAVVIPCCNEEATIADLVRKARQYLPVVIVVDDGSIDHTAGLAAEAGAEVVRLERNSGKGAALKAGAARARVKSCAWMMTMDGDGQHLPADTPAFLRCAEETQAELVVGNRMHHAQAIPGLRRFVNGWMSRRISRRAGRFLPDSQCGFRLVNLEAWTALGLKTDHFEIESEMLLAFIRAGYRVAFIPIQIIPKGPHSHMSPVRDAVRWFQWWHRSHCG